MHRRAFCTTTLGAGIVAALPASATLSALKAMTALPGDLQAIGVDGEALTIERVEAQELQRSLHGRLLFPSDEHYETVRRVWNGMVDKRPAMIAQCLNAEDVSKAVTFAAERRLLLSVKGGGHSFSGKCVAEGGLMLDLGAMRQVTVDTESKTARAQGGALLGHLDGATLPHHLVTTTGTVSHTGIGGFTLGGGFGRTDRVHGLAVDNVLGATLVTADGKIRKVNAEENQDLYWAVRGGGGNFGVVTEFIYRLHPFNPTIYGGSVFYPFSQAKDVLTYWAEVNDGLPDAASVEPQLYPTPEGGRVFELQLFFAGDHAAGEKLFAKFAQVGKPDKVDLGPKSYQEVQTMWDELTAHGQQNYIKSGLLPGLTPAAIEAVVESFEGENLPGTWFQHLGGASSRVDPQATAYPHREVHSNYGIAGIWREAEENEARIARIREIYAAVEPHMKGFYSNLNEDTRSRTQRNYGVNYDRLLRIKSKYDPENLFRLNANIEPEEKAA